MLPPEDMVKGLMALLAKKESVPWPQGNPGIIGDKVANEGGSQYPLPIDPRELGQYFPPSEMPWSNTQNIIEDDPWWHNQGDWPWGTSEPPWQPSDDPRTRLYPGYEWPSERGDYPGDIGSMPPDPSTFNRNMAIGGGVTLLGLLAALLKGIPQAAMGGVLGGAGIADPAGLYGRGNIPA